MRGVCWMVGRDVRGRAEGRRRTGQESPYMAEKTASICVSAWPWARQMVDWPTTSLSFFPPVFNSWVMQKLGQLTVLVRLFLRCALMIPFHSAPHLTEISIGKPCLEPQFQDHHLFVAGLTML